MSNPINVKCAVNSCRYNKPGNLCSAGTIEIKPAGSNTETDCATFTKG